MISDILSQNLSRTTQNLGNRLWELDINPSKCLVLPLEKRKAIAAIRIQGQPNLQSFFSVWHVSHGEKGKCMNSISDPTPISISSALTSTDELRAWCATHGSHYLCNQNAQNVFNYIGHCQKNTNTTQSKHSVSMLRQRRITEYSAYFHWLYVITCND